MVIEVRYSLTEQVSVDVVEPEPEDVAVVCPRPRRLRLHNEHLGQEEWAASWYLIRSR